MAKALGVGSEEEENDSNSVRDVQWRLQRDLSSLLFKAARDSVLDDRSLSLGEVARIAHCGMHGAWRWLTVLPVESALELSDFEFEAAMRHMCGVVLSGRYCVCGSLLDSSHLNVCKHIHSAATTGRHDVVARELCDASRLVLQAAATQKPRYKVTKTVIDPNSEQRKELEPDVLIQGVNLRLALDVSFVYGESKTHLPDGFGAGDDGNDSALRCVNKAMDSVEARDRDKVRKYTAVCEEHGITFAPFVLESHGYASKPAVGVLESMAKYAERMFGSRFAPTVGYLQRRLAIAIQRGAAECERKATTAARNRFGAAVAMGLRIASD